MKQLLFLLLLSLPCLGQRPGSPAPAPSALARPVQPLPYACVEAVSGQQHTADSLL